jgi:hypothetical protein
VTVAPAATVAVPARGDCLYPTYETIATWSTYYNWNS